MSVSFCLYVLDLPWIVLKWVVRFKFLHKILPCTEMPGLPQLCSKSPITWAFPDHTLKTSASSTGLLLLTASSFSRHLVNVNVSHDAFC